MRAVAGPSLRPLPAPPRGPGADAATRPSLASPACPRPRERSSPVAPRSLSGSGLSRHCAVGRMQSPPLFMSLERRSREPLAREASASYCKSWFFSASFVASFGGFLDSQICNLGMWIIWATALRRFFFSRSWKDSEFVCSDIQRSPVRVFGKSDGVADLSKS